MKTIDDFFDMEEVKSFYGVTSSLDNCGYILPDGTMLSYRSSRNHLQEHFHVYKFYKNSICDCKLDPRKVPKCENKIFCKYSIRNNFLYYGGIRCIPEAGLINLSRVTRGCKDKVIRYLEHNIFNKNRDVTMDVVKFQNKVRDDNEFISVIKNIEYTLDKSSDLSEIIERVNRIYAA